MQLIEALWQQLIAWPGTQGLSRLAGVVVIGWLGLSLGRSALERLLSRTQLDPILKDFLRPLVRIAILIVIAVAALDAIGVPTASVLAALGAAGLAIGLALRDSLSNIAMGVMLIVRRPFKAGDFIEVGTQSGTVASLDLLHTVLTTPDQRRLYVPNNRMGAEIIVNHSASALRRCEVTLTIGSAADIEHARALALQQLRDEPEVPADPAPEVVVVSQTDAGVQVLVRCWAVPQQLPTLRERLYERLLAEFDTAGIGQRPRAPAVPPAPLAPPAPPAPPAPAAPLAGR